MRVFRADLAQNNRLVYSSNSPASSFIQLPVVLWRVEGSWVFLIFVGLPISVDLAWLVFRILVLSVVVCAGEEGKPTTELDELLHV